MITVSNLTKTFGRLKAVDGLSFEVLPGQAVALWGPNGAGKTTVIRCLMGLLRYRGRILVAGDDVQRAGKACRRAIGYVSQELAFYDDFRVVEALRFFARLKRVSPQRPGAVLDEVGLAEHARKRIAELSGGMKQRLSLAIALLADPPILALDELTSNLDRAAQAVFLSMLDRQKSRGKTILFASHRIDEVEMLADRVVILDAGRLQLQCRPGELVEAAELRCVLDVCVAEEQVEQALRTLRQHEYEVTRNQRGVLVQIAADDKAGPIQALVRADVTVRDFELVNGHVRPPRGGSSRE